MSVIEHTSGTRKKKASFSGGFFLQLKLGTTRARSNRESKLVSGKDAFEGDTASQFVRETALPHSYIMSITESKEFHDNQV